ERDLFPCRRQCEGPRSRAAGDVGAPVSIGRTSLDRTEHTTADDEDAAVAPCVIDNSLNVEPRPQVFERPDDPERQIRIAHAYQPVTHRAENRLDHYIAHRAGGGYRPRRLFPH